MKRVMFIFASAWLAFAAGSVACPAAFPQSAPPATQAQSQNTSMTQAENSSTSAAALAGRRLSFEQMLPALPRRVESKSGAPGDMVNLLIVGSKEQVADAFQAAGWIQPDKTTQDAIVHAIQETMAHEAHGEMPISQEPRCAPHAKMIPLGDNLNGHAVDEPEILRAAKFESARRKLMRRNRCLFGRVPQPTLAGIARCG